MTGFNTHRLRGLFISAVLILMVFSTAAKAADKAADKAAAAAAATAAAEAAAKEKARLAAVEAKRKQMEAAKKKLNSTAWEVEVVQTNTNAKEKKSHKDTIRFIEDKVESQHLLDKGFTRTNFSVRVKESKITPEGRIFWETMQTHPKGEQIAFWRGELEGETMRGVLSWHLNEKEIIDYTFASTSKEAIDPAMFKEKPEPERPAPEPPKKPAEKPKAEVKAKAEAKKQGEKAEKTAKEAAEAAPAKAEVTEAKEEAVKEAAPPGHDEPNKKKRWGIW